jgi:hypothetical protein
MAQHGSLPTICKQENIANAKELGFYDSLSSDNKELLHSLTSATSNPFANRAKTELINVVYKRADAEFIAKNPMLYGCSGIDIELPILLGARNITLRDMAFDGRLNQQLESRLKAFEHYEKTDNTYTIGHDFGKGEEAVTIKVENGDIRHLEPNTQYGFIMEFLGMGAMNDKCLDPEFTSHLMIGGYLRADDTVDYSFQAICNTYMETIGKRGMLIGKGFSLIEYGENVFLLKKGETCAIPSHVLDLIKEIKDKYLD